MSKVATAAIIELAQIVTTRTQALFARIARRQAKISATSSDAIQEDGKLKRIKRGGGA